MTRQTQNTKYWKELKKDYFSTLDTIEKAYDLGFIAGDGNIQDSMIRLRIVKDDEEIINGFKSRVNYNKPNKYVKLKIGREQVHLEFRSTQMCKDLARYGIVPNKSMKIRLPNINDHYMRFYLLGLFDADGSIFYSSFLRAGRKLKQEQYRFSITTNMNMCRDIKTYLECILPITLNIIPLKKNPNLGMLQVSRNCDMITICEYLYNDHSLGLTRKRDKFLEAKKFYLDRCSTTKLHAPNIQGDDIVSS